MDALPFYASEQMMHDPRQEHPSSLTVDAVNDQAFALKTINPARAIMLTEAAEKMAHGIEYKAGVGMAMAIRAYALVQIDDSFAAQDIGTEALSICETLRLHRGCGCAFFGIASGLLDAGDLEAALETVYRALDMFERSGDRDAVANALLVLSVTYSMLNNVDHTEKYAMHAIP